MSDYSYKEVISGALYDFLSDWKSDYKIQEDLPAIAEELTEWTLKCLGEHGYKIIKEEDKDV